MLEFVQRGGDRGYFPRPEGMPEVLHHLLIQRGVRSAEEAEAFLNPSAAQLRDPMLLNDMAEAVSRIRSAVAAGERICVYGDYDVDGVCASAILYSYLRALGADAEVYLPSRHDEGYGLNEAAVRAIAQRCGLLVTVDCGIASHDLIELAKPLGLGVVVTDHHRPGEMLPECPVVNPLLGGYPFGYLCGAGVALKLVWALGGEEAAMGLIDLAAIATVADVVPLQDENRAIVHLGLQAINAAPRPGVKALMDSARVEAGALDAQGVGFRLAPRLNAGGRLGSARRSFELLIEQDAFLAIAQADALEQENIRRQTVEREIRAQAEQQLEGFDFSAHRILLVRGEGWNPGVIGLTASHLREKYHYPVIVFSQNDGMLTGSCRSIEGVDIYQTLCRADDLLEKFGGHSQAAGLTLKVENFEALWARLDAYLFEYIPARAWLPVAEYDVPASISAFTEATVRMLSALEPTGCANPEPVFRAQVDLIEARAIGAQGAHLRILASQGGARRAGIFFGAGEMAHRLGDAAEILFTPQLNRWNGRTDVQLLLRAMRETDAAARIAAARPREAALLRGFLTELFYNRGIASPAAPEPIALGALCAQLEEAVQGTWVLCGSLELAQQIMDGAELMPPDLCIGHLPEDVRAFSSVIVCPDRLAPLPPAVRTLVLAGVPEPAGLEGIRVLSLAGADAGLAAVIPDVNGMREVYKAFRRLAARPLRLKGMEALAHALAAESGETETACLLSVLTLMDMQLIAVHDKPFTAALLPAHKTDPDSSAVWRSLQACRQMTEGRGNLK